MSTSTDISIDRAEPGESAIAKLWEKRQQLALQYEHFGAILDGTHVESATFSTAEAAYEPIDEALWNCDDLIISEPFTDVRDIAIKARVVYWRMSNERPFAGYVAQLINDIRTLAGETGIENWGYVDFAEGGFVDGVTLNYYDARKPAPHILERMEEREEATAA